MTSENLGVLQPGFRPYDSHFFCHQSHEICDTKIIISLFISYFPCKSFLSLCPNHLLNFAFLTYAPTQFCSFAQVIFLGHIHQNKHSFPHAYREHCPQCKTSQQKEAKEYKTPPLVAFRLSETRGYLVTLAQKNNGIKKPCIKSFKLTYKEIWLNPYLSMNNNIELE